MNINQTQIQKETNDLLRATFKDRDDILKAVRVLLYGEKLTEQESALIKNTFSNDLLRKRFIQVFFHEADPRAEIGMNIDYWAGVESMINGAHPDAVKQILMSRMQLLSWFRAFDELLVNPDQESRQVFVSVDPVFDDEEVPGVYTLARTLYIKTIEGALVMVKMIANNTDEDIEQLRENARKNSAK